MFKPRMNIAVSLDSNYARYTYVMLTSLFENQDNEWDIHIFLLQSGLKFEEKRFLEDLIGSRGGILHWMNINPSLFSAECLAVTEWSMEIYYRLMLQDILPIEVDRILYLDVDVIINKSLKELYTTDFEGNLLCACSEPFAGLGFFDVHNQFFKQQLKEGFIYFNSDVLLLNIKELRKKYHLETYLNIAKALPYKLVASDQDLLNFVHWKEVKILDSSKYNLFARFAYNCGVSYQEAKDSATIIHFNRSKGKCHM